MFVCW